MEYKEIYLFISCILYDLSAYTMAGTYETVWHMSMDKDSNTSLLWTKIGHTVKNRTLAKLIP